MVTVKTKSQTLHYEGSDEFEAKVKEYVKTDLGASTDGQSYHLRKREHVAQLEEYVEELKRADRNAAKKAAKEKKS